MQNQHSEDIALDAFTRATIMLILTRRPGEGVMCGPYMVRLEHVTLQRAYVAVDKIEHCLTLGDKVRLPDGDVALMAITPYGAKLGFEFPRHVEIVREELLPHDK